MDMETIKKKVLEDVDPEVKRQKKKEMRIQRLIITVQLLAIIIVVVLLFYAFMGISTVSGESMYPTLHDKDVVVYKRRTTEYKPGDIIAVRRPDGEEYVKRIIAVPGDTVNLQNGNVYVNGEKVVTEAALGKTEAKSDEMTYPLVVGDKEFFVLGDNREISRDSREIGTISQSDIKGRIIWYMGRP